MRLNFVQLSEKRRVILQLGDITKEDVNEIVSATNQRLNVNTRVVVSALNRASNGDLQKHAEQWSHSNK